MSQTTKLISVFFDGTSAQRLLQTKTNEGAKFVDVKILTEGSDKIRGFSHITFRHGDQSYHASCDTKYEGVYSIAD